MDKLFNMKISGGFNEKPSKDEIINLEVVNKYLKQYVG